jgi:hypothetical protein
MFGVFFSILVAAALVGVIGEFAMRARLTGRSPDKLGWWRRGGDEVAATYELLFPNSLLPRYRRIFFWIFLSLSSVLLLTVLWKHR